MTVNKFIKKRYRAARPCATVKPGAQNTTKQAGNLPDSEVFSRPKFMVLDVGIVYPQGRRHNLFCVLNPHIHPECLKSARDGFSVQQGTKTMTNVTTLASRRAALSCVQTPASFPALTPSPAGHAPAPEPHAVERQQAIENALSTALYFIRQPYSATALHAATGRASRALSLLKNACTEAQNGGAA